MEGVDTLPAPHILSVLVGAELGEELYEQIRDKNRPITVKVQKIIKPDTAKRIRTSVSFHCSPSWDEPVCPEGTSVEVLVEGEWKRGVVNRELPDYKHLLVGIGKNSLNEEKVHRSLVHRLPDFAECQVGETRIEHAEGPRNCQTNIRVHSALLCSHNELLPPKKLETEKIQCGASIRPEKRKNMLSATNMFGVGADMRLDEDLGGGEIREEL